MQTINYWFLLISLMIVSCLRSQELPYQTAKKKDKLFYQLIKDMNIIYQKTINHKTFSSNVYMYKSSNTSTEDLEQTQKAIIQIGDFYSQIGTGWDPELDFADIAGSDGNYELILNTGCMTNASCYAKTYVIRIFHNTPFTVTDFGYFSQIPLKSKEIEITKPDDFEFKLYEESVFRSSFIALKRKGEFMVITESGDEISTSKEEKELVCYKLIRSYTTSRFGFRQTLYYKKLKTVCVA